MGRGQEQKHFWWLDLTQICQMRDGPQWLSIRQQETSAEEIMTFYSNFLCLLYSFIKKTTAYDTMEKKYLINN